jgi:hypothetical protein
VTRSAKHWTVDGARSSQDTTCSPAVPSGPGRLLECSDHGEPDSRWRGPEPRRPTIRGYPWTAVSPCSVILASNDWIVGWHRAWTTWSPLVATASCHSTVFPQIGQVSTWLEFAGRSGAGAGHTRRRGTHRLPAPRARCRLRRTRDARLPGPIGVTMKGPTHESGQGASRLRACSWLHSSKSCDEVRILLPSRRRRRSKASLLHCDSKARG